MSVADRRRQDVESSMNRLSVSTAASASAGSQPATSSSMTTGAKRSSKNTVADSWEDEADGPSDEDADGATTPTTPTALHPTVPPPTPASPSGQFHEDLVAPYAPSNAFSSASWEQAGAGASATSGKRPEKSTATAQRMIAGALGVRAPKKTEEMRAYEKAVKDNERKRIASEKEDRVRREEEERKAKESVWDD